MKDLEVLPNSSGVLWTIFAAVACIAILLLGGPILKIINAVRKPRYVKKAQMAAANRRDQKQERQLYVRQTDIESTMSREDKQRHQHAQELIKQKQFIEAANLLESIRFQRQAIDILEQNGLIEEACNILMRLKAPTRAAVLYDRNNMLEKAAQHYLMANQHEKAADAYLRLGKTQYLALFKATELFEQLNDTDGIIESAAHSLQTEKVLSNCLEHKRYIKLYDYMRDPSIARSILHKIDDNTMRVLVENMPLLPIYVQMTTNWLWLYPKGVLCVYVLKHLSQDQHLAKFFWSALPQALLNHLFETIKLHAKYLSAQMLMVHINALNATEHAQEANALHQIVQQATAQITSLSDIEPPKANSFVPKAG